MTILRKFSTCLLCLALLSSNCGASQTKRPNIVFIMADDLGWDDVGFHGSQQIPTPNLDALAYDGVILGNYYVQPLCTPSRAALLTGRYPIHLGLQHDVPISAQPYGLPLNETLLPQYLKPLGYRSHIVGKWHLGFFKDDYLPTRRGFESHYGYYQGCGGYYDHTYAGAWPDDHKSWGFDFHRNGAVERAVFGEYSTELFTAQAEDVIARHNTSEPLFLYVAHQAVHSGNPDHPLVAPWKYMQRVSHIKSASRRAYAAMASALDDSVGNITRALHNRGMLNNTVIVFSTDNGGPAHGFNFNDASNWPLRGLKASLWEGGVRGTGFVWSPLLRKSGYTSDRLIHVVDWLPTLLHAAAATGETDLDGIDGIDQWNVLTEDSAPVRSEVLLNIDQIEKSKSIRVGDLKLVVAEKGYTRNCAGWYPTDEADVDFTASPCDSGFVGDLDRVSINEGDAAHGRDADHEISYLASKPNRGNFDADEIDNRFRLEFSPSDQQRRRWNSQWSDRDHVPDLKRPRAEPWNQRRSVHGNGIDSGERIDAHNSGIMTMSDSPPSDVVRVLVELRRGRRQPAVGSPLIVRCGPRPANASTNCRPWLAPCLFNVTADPCEFSNIALDRPDLVKFLSQRLEGYERSARTPLNKPIDDAGLPYHHNWTWIPWVTDDVGRELYGDYL